MPVNPPSWRNDTVLPLPNEVIANAWAVDAACSGNPGPMEYQCIDLQTGAQVFHYGPIHGTNNIGEFLAIVHARAENWLRTHPINIPIIKWETKKWGEIPADFGRKG